MNKISVIDIDNYLSNRPNLYEIFNKNNGIEYIQKVIQIADLTKFDTYYLRIKKLTLLRIYSHLIDVSWLYDPSTLDIKKASSRRLIR